MIEFYNQIHGLLINPDRLPVAAGALVLSAVVGMVTGPLAGNGNPLYWAVIETLFGGLGTRLDRPNRAPGDLLFRGFFMVTMVLGVSFYSGSLAEDFLRKIPFKGGIEAVVLSFTLTSGSVWFSLLRLYRALKAKKVVEGAYYAIARTTCTDLSGSDDFGITRAGMALAARAFDRGLVAPVLCYLVAGLPGACMYAGLAALAWRFHDNGSSNNFRSIICGLEKFFGFVPTVFSGLVIALAGLFTPTGGMTRALAGLLRRRGQAPYGQGGLPVTAMAWSLDVALGGPITDIEGHKISYPWVGPENATARLESGHLRRALYISAMAHLLFLAGLMSAMLFAGKNL